MASYYSVDAILTDAQKVPCAFELDLPGLGFIDGNIKKGTQVNLPLWLGGYLAVQKFGEPILTTDLPPSLAPRVLNALKANPRTVDLRALASHFYELSARVLDLFDEDEIVDVLTMSFKARAAEIADHATHTQGALVEASGFLRGLDEMERQLFRAAHDSSRAVKAWLGESTKKKA
ncbi:MAG: DNA replication protein [Gomphillus americanus]|uniref:DNA replication complex GINS protein PSF3 n=1 Tax=Gomphillus americanus TaxID=1940652 RepID=A0A8H3I8F7_9LECA|nr:MAG: DNA replication protein [Gomphillus americanus]